jgi:hypothetical protein
MLGSNRSEGLLVTTAGPRARLSIPLTGERPRSSGAFRQSPVMDLSGHHSNASRPLKAVLCGLSGLPERSATAVPCGQRRVDHVRQLRTVKVITEGVELTAADRSGRSKGEVRAPFEVRPSRRAGSFLALRRQTADLDSSPRASARTWTAHLQGLRRRSGFRPHLRRRSGHSTAPRRSCPGICFLFRCSGSRDR